MTAIARMPSLMQLRRIEGCEDPEPDLSPLYTAGLQPLLPQLHSFEFLYVRDIYRLSEQATAVLIDVSIAFLTAYSAQLQVLELLVYTSDSAGGLISCVLQCSQLRKLTLDDSFCRLRRDVSPADLVVDRLDEAVSSLPPLRLLTKVCAYHFGERALTQSSLNALRWRQSPSSIVNVLGRHHLSCWSEVERYRSSSYDVAVAEKRHGGGLHQPAHGAVVIESAASCKAGIDGLHSSAAAVKEEERPLQTRQSEEGETLSTPRKRDRPLTDVQLSSVNQ